MQQQNVNEFIQHHGVKGMRWGVRRARRGTSGGPASSTYKKPAHRLSDAELSKRIKRMDMEKRYSELTGTGPKPSAMSKGSKFASGILSNVGRNVITTVATGAALLGVAAAIKKSKGGTPELARALTGK